MKTDPDPRAQRRRDALMQVFAQNNLTPTEASRAAGFSTANALFNFIHGRTRSLSQGTYEKLAAVIPGATVDLLAGNDLEASAATAVSVRSYVRLGEWRTNFDLPLREQYKVPVALDPRDMNEGPFGVEVRRPGAENIYAEGTMLVVVPLAHCLTYLTPGVRVILQRMLEGKMEVSVQELQVIDDKAWLLPQTALPRYQAATPIPWPYNGRMWRQGETRFAIAGLVIMNTTREVVL